MPIFAASNKRSLSASPAMKCAIGKANTSQNSTRGQNRPRYPFGELRQPRVHGEPTEQADANGLPNAQPNHDGHSHGIRESPGLDRHARIGEGEQRHNHKTDPRVQSDFQPLQVRDGFSRRPLYRLQDGLTSVRIVPRISLEKSPKLEAGGV